MSEGYNLNDLPDLPFRGVLKHLQRKDVLNLSLVSSGVRERIRQLSDVLQTFHLKKLGHNQLLQLADLMPEIKGVSAAECYSSFCVKTNTCCSESIEYLLKTHPELESLNVPCHISGKCAQSLLSHTSMGHLKINKESSETLEPHFKYSEKLKTLNIVDISDSEIECILKLARNLKSLTICGKNITGKVMNSNVENPVNLKELNLEWCPNVTEAGLCSILRCTPNLTLLYINGTQISGEGWENMSPLLKLESLTLTHCDNVTNLGLSTIIKKVPNLKIFCIKYQFINVSVSSVPFIGLESLAIENCGRLYGGDVNSILNQSPNLKSLKISGGTIMGDFRCETSLLKLKSLCLTRLRGPLDVGLSSILERVPNLKELELRSLPLTDIGLECRDNLNHLETFIISGCKKVTGVAVNSILNKSPNLRSLEMCKIEILNGSLSLNNPLFKLESLWLESVKITNRDLCTILRLGENLQTIVLQDFKITGPEINCPAMLTKLVSLKLMILEMTALFLISILRQTENLLHLDLQYLLLFGQDFYCPAPLTKLESIIIHQPFFSGVGITDVGLCSILRQVPNLRILDLQGLRISGVNWNISEPLKQLDSMTLNNIDFKDTGLNSILRLAPNLRSLDIKGLQKWDEVKECDDWNFSVPFKKLECVKLHNLAITDACLSSMLKQTNLRRLDLKESEITGESLNLSAPLDKLEDITLENLEITDLGLSSILRWTQNLRTLSVQYAKITGEELNIPAPLTKLESFNVEYCELLTTEGVVKMFTLAPNLQEFYLSMSRKDILKNLETYWNRIKFIGDGDEYYSDEDEDENEDGVGENEDGENA